MNFSQKDADQIVRHGLSEETVNRQIANFVSGFAPLPIVRAAVTGDGILSLDQSALRHLIDRYEQQRGLIVVKFVPASGAATRMFKDLYEFLSSGVRNNAVDTLLQSLGRFAFYDRLHSLGTNLRDSRSAVGAIVGRGLDYGSMPKGLILFHRNEGIPTTAAEEHLTEGALYAASDGHAAIHFTISPEHQERFEKLIAEAIPRYEERYGIHYEVNYSCQKSSTDTIAVNPDNTPFRNPDGSLLFRPAGHGALLENLQEIDADLVFIKTVDNVAPDHLKGDTILYKKVLAGLALELQGKTFALLSALDNHLDGAPEMAARFIEEELSHKLPADFATLDEQKQVATVRRILDRPLRVCGMVRNEGEPGGGPFWVKDEDGGESLQIAESSQIAPESMELMRLATHFNPVDLVCAVRDYRGSKFDLRRYTDPSTGFISTKSRDGQPLKAQELPGLWNGAMAQWNTVFVEVPITTFSPVKVVNDLLRRQHQ